MHVPKEHESRNILSLQLIRYMYFNWYFTLVKKMGARFKGNLSAKEVVVIVPER